MLRRLKRLWNKRSPNDSRRVVREDPAVSAHLDSTVEGDWELIKAIDSGLRSRRALYEPGIESFCNQEAAVASRGHVRESSADPAPERADGAAAAVPPAPSGGPFPEPAECWLPPSPRLSHGAAIDLAASSNLRSDGPTCDRDAIEELVDFEGIPEDPEEQAQRRFEQGLVLAADMESEIDVEDDPLEDSFAEVEGLPGFDSDDDLESAWEAFAFDADEFDATPTQEALSQVSAKGSLTRRQRAQQYAIELGLEVGWDEEGIAVLTEVFHLYGWSQCKVSMRRELQAGMTPEELAVAMEVRTLWAAHPEFSMDLGWFEGRGWGESARAIYGSLSWPMALALVRLHDGYPDIDFLEHFLCELFDDWYSNRSLQRRCRSFNLYLFRHLGISGRGPAVWPGWTFTPDPALGLELDEDHEPGTSSPRYRTLNRLGLVADPRPVAVAYLRPTITSHAASSAPKEQRGAKRRPTGDPVVQEFRSTNRSRVEIHGNRILSTPREISAGAGACDTHDATPVSDGSTVTRKGLQPSLGRARSVTEGTGA